MRNEYSHCKINKPLKKQGKESRMEEKNYRINLYRNGHLVKHLRMKCTMSDARCEVAGALFAGFADSAALYDEVGLVARYVFPESGVEYDGGELDEL